jgi:3'-phosphoadenosine 5'-phosphosulfate sulfotransferase (PAPS reductase)/FAD synthetase
MAKRSPFLIDGPAVISLSGGRTSAYMLRRILDEGLQPDVHVLFCNTGKEYAETLAFVDEIDRQWTANVHWLEYERQTLPTYKSKEVAAIAERFRAARPNAAWRQLPRRPALNDPRKERGFREVTFKTAARNGEPYENFVAMSGLPNPAFRTCTTEMKVRIMKRWMLEHGYAEWDMVMGIRADEPQRVSKLRRSPPERWEHVMPLADAKIDEACVIAFWKTQSFDLGLPIDDVLGTYRGNCDGCILKATGKLLRIEREEPGRLAWWAKVERDSGSVFRRDRAGYQQLRVLASDTGFVAPDDDLGDCFCHD